MYLLSQSFDDVELGFLWPWDLNEAMEEYKATIPVEEIKECLEGLDVAQGSGKICIFSKYTHRIEVNFSA